MSVLLAKCHSHCIISRATMLCTSVAIVFLLGCQIEGAVIQNDKKASNRANELTNLITKKCLKNADEAEQEKILEEHNSLKNCWNPTKYMNIQALTVNCFETRNDAIKCLTEFLEQSQHCLNPDEGYLQQFILDRYGNSSKYLCEHINVSELFTPASIECGSKLKDNPEINPNFVCYEKSTLFGKENSSVDVITKADLCSELLNIHNCYEEMFDEHCAEDSEFKKLRLGMIKEGLISCSDITDESTEESTEDHTKDSIEALQ